MDSEELLEINHRAGLMPFSDRLDYLLERFKGRIGMTTAFGYSGMLLIHHLADKSYDGPVYFIDTQFHFPETLEFYDRIKNRYDLNFKTIQTELSESEIEGRIGEKAFFHNPDACCEIRKVQPLEKVLETKEIWLHGLRRDQSSTRESLEFIEWDERGVLKAYPLYDMKRAECWKQIWDLKIPYHPLHDKDFPSIGCQPCTNTSCGGGERDGRWVSFPKTECGIHRRTQQG